MTDTSGEWILSQGPNRPIWEPVRLADFADERLEALHALRMQLHKEVEGDIKDDRLALYAIIETLMRQTVVTADQGKAMTIVLATQRLPQPEGNGRKKLKARRRDDLILVVGQMWEVFTAHNFPLNRSAS